MESRGGGKGPGGRGGLVPTMPGYKCPKVKDMPGGHGSIFGFK